VGVVVAGYLAAVPVAMLIARVFGGSDTSGRASAGMTAFGDGVLFVVALGIASIPATGAALFFLRSRPAFWRVLAGVSLVLVCAALGVVGLVAVAWLSGPR
jgi:hypothetical protein